MSIAFEGGREGGWGPTFAEQSTVGRRSLWRGALRVCRLELVKLSGQLRIRALAVAAVIGPFAIVAGLNLQSATPGDTPFGQWVHTSGFAIPMTILGFGAQWLLPVLAAIVAGDIFSSEDHFGTWKTILTRSRGRGELFTGKLLAAVAYTVAMQVLLTVTDLVAGLLAGTEPVVGLGGQLVQPGHAVTLEVASYLSELPPMLAFTAIALLISVLSRTSIAGIGIPVLLAVLLQVVTLINLPEWGQLTLPSHAFVTWHGLWSVPGYYGPLAYGAAVSTAWFVVCTAGAWLVFRRRSFGVAE
jgi:ABC-2 type transport system permease protein